jgi:hypothetical protein
VLLTVMLVIDVVFENSPKNIGFCFPDAMIYRARREHDNHQITDVIELL